HVAADIVGAQREAPASAVLPEGRTQQRVAELLGRGMRRQDVGEGGGQHQRDDDDQADHRAGVLAEIAPELDQGMRRGGGMDGARRGFGGGHAQRPLRMRGLMSPYITSTVRLTIITIEAASSTPPWTTG